MLRPPAQHFGTRRGGMPAAVVVARMEQEGPSLRTGGAAPRRAATGGRRRFRAHPRRPRAARRAEGHDARLRGCARGRREGRAGGCGDNRGRLSPRGAGTGGPSRSAIPADQARATPLVPAPSPAVTYTQRQPRAGARGASRSPSTGETSTIPGAWPKQGQRCRTLRTVARFDPSAGPFETWPAGRTQAEHGSKMPTSAENRPATCFRPKHVVDCFLPSSPPARTNNLRSGMLRVLCASSGPGPNFARALISWSPSPSFDGTQTPRSLQTVWSGVGGVPQALPQPCGLRDA